MSFLPVYVCALWYDGRQAWLGFYNGQLRRVRWTKDDLVAQANYWITTVCRQPEVPAIQAKTLGKMGLRGVRKNKQLKRGPDQARPDQTVYS